MRIETTPIITATPVTVAQGGTGVATLGDAGVLVGNAAGAVQVTGTGTSGQVLTSNGAGVDPTFQAATGNWSLLGSTTLGSPATTVSVSSFAAKLYLKVIIWISGISTASLVEMQFNSDTATNYTWSLYNYTAGTFGASDDAIRLDGNSQIHPFWGEVDIYNEATVRKYCKSLGVKSSGIVSTTPKFQIGGGEWDNASNQITTVTIKNFDGATFNIGSLVQVWGHD